MWVPSLECEDLLKEEMATHFVFLPRNPRRQRILEGYMGSQREGHDEQLNNNASLMNKQENPHKEG